MLDDMSFEDAATTPCVYRTVIHSLLEVGQFEADQVSSNSVAASWSPLIPRLFFSILDAVGLVQRQFKYAK